jgi:hypothetical protein
LNIILNLSLLDARPTKDNIKWVTVDHDDAEIYSEVQGDIKENQKALSKRD